MLNQVELIGHLGGDPDCRFTPNGTPVANFSIATTFRWSKDGQTNERTEWHRIVAWGKLADVCRDYLKKGKQVYVHGRLQTRSWEDQQGQKRYTTEVVAGTILMLGKRDDREELPAGDSPAVTTPATADDDLPF